MSFPDNPCATGWRDYVRLCRVSNLPTVWMNAVAAYVLSGGPFSPMKMSMLLIAVSTMYCGGMAMNDCIDSTVDALRRPSRPIPSGRMSVSRGTAAYTALFALSVPAFAAAGGPHALVAGLILLGLVVIYNLAHNASVLAVLPMAGCRFMIYIIAGLAFSGGVRGPLLALASVQFAYVLALSLLARLEKTRMADRGGIPPIPVLLAGIPVIDGLALGHVVNAWWAAAGIAFGAAALVSQRKIRGD